VTDGEHEQVTHAARVRIAYATDEDPATMARIFEPSWLSSSLDLHMAYRLVKKMGGLMAAGVERGDQATFDIYLPQVKVAASGAPLPKSTGPAILLVDSNAEVRRLLYTEFERQGLHLLTAASWEEGLLVADLYRESIPLAIANLRGTDEKRYLLEERLTASRPGIRVRLLNGYSERGRAVAGQTLDPAAERHLTKWDLIDWARDAIAAENATAGPPRKPVGGSQSQTNSNKGADPGLRPKHHTPPSN